jgi:hypothetical protein
MKTVHARDLKATQGEFSDKGVKKMMSTGGRPSDSAESKIQSRSLSAQTIISSTDIIVG